MTTNTRSIAYAVADYLTRVVGHDEDGRSVGLSYDEVLDLLKQELPHAETSRKTLATYVQYIKVERDGWAKKVAAAGEGRALPQVRPKCGTKVTTKAPASEPLTQDETWNMLGEAYDDFESTMGLMPTKREGKAWDATLAA